MGDVVLYNPPALANDLQYMEGENPIILNPTSMIDRVVAEPGQTFERRGGIFYRDGRKVPVNEEPLKIEFLPGDFKLTAPPGKYIILFSYTFSGGDLMYSTLGWDPKAPRLEITYKNSKSWVNACTIARKDITGQGVVCL